MRLLTTLPPSTLGWILILLGCCSNVLCLEFLTKYSRSSGNLITFTQFCFIAAEGGLGQIEWNGWTQLPTWKKRIIPLTTYILLTSIFFLASLLNNAALNYNISMPVHTVFRSSGLAGTLVTGYLFFGKRYTLHQISSCLCVCGGIVMLTLADGQRKAIAAVTNTAGAVGLTPGCCGNDAATAAGNATAAVVNATLATLSSSGVSAALSNETLYSWLETFLPSLLHPLLLTFHPFLSTLPLSSLPDIRWLLGISMLTCTLFLLSTLGHLQDATYKKYGKIWRETMFYTHLLAIPCFWTMRDDIWQHVVAWSKPESFVPHTIPRWITGSNSEVEVTYHIPLFVYLLFNLLTQSVCFKGVSILTSHTSALTCTVALTLRKFISLLLSIWYFQNEFTSIHWAGATLVFAGIMAYANPNLCGKEKKEDVKEEKLTSSSSSKNEHLAVPSASTPFSSSSSILSPSYPPHTISGNSSAPPLRGGDRQQHSPAPSSPEPTLDDPVVLKRRTRSAQQNADAEDAETSGSGKKKQLGARTRSSSRKRA